MDSGTPRVGMRVATVAPAAVCGGLFAVIRLGDPDTWVHLAVGRLLWGGVFPTVNTFSHTYPDHPWRNPEWLFQILLAGAEKAGGLVGVQLVAVVVLAAAAALTADSAFRVKDGPVSGWCGYGLALLALSSCRFRFVPRAELITFLGLALVVWLWVSRPRKTWAWFALLGCLWANSHPGVIFGVGALGCLALVDGAGGAGRDTWRAGALCLVSFLLGSFLTPFGPYPYLYALWHAGPARIVPVEEYAPPSLYRDLTFFVGFALVVGISVRSVASRRWRLPLLTAVFGVPALLYVRMLPVFFLVTLPFAMAQAPAAGVRGWRRRWRPWAWGGGVLVLALLLARDYGMTAPPYEFGPGVETDWVPAGAADFVLEHRLPGEMYNDYNQGEYLMWALYPAYRVFVDGRMPAYPVSFYQKIPAVESVEAWAEFMDQYEVTFAITERRPYTDVDLGSAFEMLGWSLVYWDGVSLIYVRPGTMDEDWLRRWEFEVMRRGDTPEVLLGKARRFPSAVRRDLRRIDRARLIEPRDFFLFATTAAAAGDLPLAGEFTAVGLRKHPKNRRLNDLAADLDNRMGRRK